MVKKNEAELWNTIRERLSPPDLETLISLSNDFNHRRIEKTQLIASALLLFKNDEFLHRCFTDLLQEDEEGETRNDGDTDMEEGEIREGDSKIEVYVRNTELATNTKESERNVEEAAMTCDVSQEDVVICKNVGKHFSEILSPSEFLKLISSIKDFDKEKISQSEFRESLGLLYENKGQDQDEQGQDQDEHGKIQQEVDDTDLEEGEIQEDGLLLLCDAIVEHAESNRLATRAEVDERSKEDPKIGADAEVRVSDERDLEKHVTNVEEAAMACDVSQEDVVICKNVGKLFSEILSPSEFLKLISSIQDFDKEKISQSEFRESLGLLYENRGQDQDEHGKIQQDVDDTDLEEGEIREDGLLLLLDAMVERAESNRLATRAEVDERSKEDPKIGAEAEVRVSDERELEKHVTNGFDKMNLEGKKRRILHSEPIERSRKIPRMCERLDGVTPSYRLIPEEERDPVSDDRVLNFLNNTCALAKVNGGASGHSKLTRYEEAMAICEDDMFERDIEIGALTSAVDRAEKVLGEEMRVEDLGVKFYRCIQKLCRRDMYKTVRQDHKQVLPQILTKLKQKLSKLTVARERKKPGWRQIFEENTAKQRDLNARILRRKQKAQQQI